MGTYQRATLWDLDENTESFGVYQPTAQKPEYGTRVSPSFNVLNIALTLVVEDKELVYLACAL